MIEAIETPNSDIFAFEAVGTLTKEDYEKIIKPALETAYKSGRKIRFLYVLGDRFDGFSSAAAWEDFKIGTRYLNLFERCAVVSDKGWLRNLSAFIGSLVPYPVRVFGSDEKDNAIAWLDSGAIGLDHHLDTQKKVVTVEIFAPLSSQDFQTLKATVDPWLQKGNTLNGLVIHVKKFPGWENLGSLISHIQFVKEHHHIIRRIAISADGIMASILPNISKHFVNAEVKHFSYDALNDAKAWAQSE